ncbi:uncharacterized protein LOC141612980 [Silene latifolia]|uniref:uncharacterized protein LOC141612980 n=1 Tax=Silene latifolia TaxID=37657 RepID=UPI003D77E7BE
MEARSPIKHSLEEMQPHHDLKKLEVRGYQGETIPRWPGRGDNSALFDLPNLVTLEIEDCSNLLYLPVQIGILPHLKTLTISNLLNVKYVADADYEKLVSGEGSSFFASLEKLYISGLPELKGWCRRSESSSHVVNPNEGGSIQEAQLAWVSSPCFPLLKNLTLTQCEKMMFIPLCPRLQHLRIDDSKRRLVLENYHLPSSSASYSILKRLLISNLGWLKSMPMEYSQFLTEIVIFREKRSESLGEVKELFPASLLSSLRGLHIVDCPKLKSVGGWLDHLSTLETLYVQECPKAVLGGMSIPWHSLAGSLQSLFLIEFQEMEELPEGIQYCTSLRSLYIVSWPKLKILPKWMPKLTSLQNFELLKCSESLKERCQQPNGEDWPLIRHISVLEVMSSTMVENRFMRRFRYY